MTEETTPDSQHDKRRRNRETVRAWRYRNRKQLDEQREHENYKKSLRGRLTTLWDANWKAASDEERATIEAAHLLAWVNCCALTECISNIAEGRTGPPYPDLTFCELREFFAEVPASQFWPDADVACRLDPETFEILDDDDFKRFGRFTKVPLVLWNEFLRLTESSRQTETPEEPAKENECTD